VKKKRNVLDKQVLSQILMLLEEKNPEWFIKLSVKKKYGGMKIT